MEQDKKKILSDLYAIRATMSLVAENDDSADPERDEVDDCNYTISNLEDDIKKKKKSTRSELSAFSIDKKICDLNKEYEDTEKQYDDAQAEYNYHNNLLKKNSVKAFFEDWWFEITFFPDDYPWLTFLLFPLYIVWILLLSPIFAIISTISDKRKEEEEIIRWQKEMNQYSNQMARISAEIRDLTKKRDAGEVWIECREVTVAEQRMRDFEEKTNQQIAVVKHKIPSHQSAIQAIAEKSQALIDSATKAYPLIDLRDWDNVDLLIYYFETGRADNMKEALQLVDRQRQTDQITDALEMASAEICKTIHHSLNQLGNALSQSFSLLSSQLSRQHVEMLNAMEEQALAQQAASEAQLKEIRAQAAAQTTSQVASQEMNRALLEKISESSSDLAAQMRRQMREVHDIYV